MSGSGKSSVVAELRRRGYLAVDADEDGYCTTVAVDPGLVTGIGGGRDLVWDEDRVAALLDRSDHPAIFLAGTSPNQGRFNHRFDHIVLLTASPELLAHRLVSRTNNPFGSQPDEVERTLEIQRSIEPLLRRAAHVEIDTAAPIDSVVDAIERLVGP